MENPKFKYYRRGTGELDTSNFFEIAKAGCVEVHHLDSRTLISLAIFQMYLRDHHFDLWCKKEKLTVVVTGYVCHMRADKDVYDPSIAYGDLGFTFDVRKVQHDSRNGVTSGTMDKDTLGSFSMFKLVPMTNPLWVGADSSVHKFFPEVDTEAKKVRKDGKVISLDFTLESTDHDAIVIVDDLLGGGATIQMLVDSIRNQGYTGDIFLWVEWNEGIHKPEFLDQFKGFYIGENIGGVN